MRFIKSLVAFWRKYRDIVYLLIYSAFFVIAVILAIKVFLQNGDIFQKINVASALLFSVLGIGKKIKSIFRQRKASEQQLKKSTE